LPSEAIGSALDEAAAKKPGVLSDREIDDALSKALGEALSGIAKGDYHGVIDCDAKEIIDMGLAVYGHGHRVKAAFGIASGSMPGGAALDE
jgi:hypothetical protein